MRVAVLGLGAMGSRIARRLATEQPVSGWNRSPIRDAALNGAVDVKADRGEAVAGTDLVLVMVTDELALEQTLFDNDDCVVTAAGTYIVNMSTVGPECITRLAARLPTGVHLVDAPVMGSISAVEDGSLEIFASGDSSHVEAVAETLGRLGNVTRTGGLGTGQAAKLVANNALFAVLAVLGESFALADDLGLARDVTRRVLASTPLADQEVRRRGAIESDDVPTRFSLGLAAKDAALIAGSTSTSLPCSSGAAAWFSAALESRGPDGDYTGVLRTILHASAADADADGGIGGGGGSVETGPDGRTTSQSAFTYGPVLPSEQAANAYTWGDGCLGWHLVDRPELSVIAESMPAGASEEMHSHLGARQYFYVLRGQAHMTRDQVLHRLTPGSGIEVAPGQWHQMHNPGPAALQFVVVSSPHAHGDRVTASHDDYS